MTASLHQSAVSQRAASANIALKLNILRDWVENGIPYRHDADGHGLLDAKDQKVLEFFPTSVRQFKAWDGSQNSPDLRARLPVMTTTGNDTLAQRPADHEQVKRLIAALRQRAHTQQASGRAGALRALDAELRLSKATAALRVAELREQQRTLRQLRLDHESLLRQREGDQAEFERRYMALAEELATERRRNAELSAEVLKVRPLREAPP